MPWTSSSHHLVTKLTIVRHSSCFVVQQHKLSTFSLGHIRQRQFLPEKGQRRTIVDKFELPQFLPDNYPEPWPYKQEGFAKRHILLDKSKDRHHTNSKLIVVEGNVSSGKTDFASKLADELGFHFIPGFSMNEILIDRYGNDMRKFHHLFPKRFRIPDELMFYQNPSDDQTAVMQDLILRSKWDQYLNALAHIFNTGQGVVMEKSFYSDFVFANAMRSKDWISPEYFKYYHFMRKIIQPSLHFWPHLVIYLDCPTWKCLENIKKRGNQHEIANVDEKYLKIIEDSYKDYLREVKRHSFILTYDWTVPEYMDIILSDIGKVDLDWVEWHSGDQLEEWLNIGTNTNYGHKRYQMTHKSELHYTAFLDLEFLHFEIAELHVYPPDASHMVKVMQHEVLKSVLGYGFTEKDAKAGTTNMDPTRMTPEKWYDYYWKEYWFNSIRPPDWQIDPYGKGYDPYYLHH